MMEYKIDRGYHPTHNWVYRIDAIDENGFMVGTVFTTQDTGPAYEAAIKSLKEFVKDK